MSIIVNFPLPEGNGIINVGNPDFMWAHQTATKNKPDESHPLHEMHALMTKLSADLITQTGRIANRALDAFRMSRQINTLEDTFSDAAIRKVRMDDVRNLGTKIEEVEEKCRELSSGIMEAQNKMIVFQKIEPALDGNQQAAKGLVLLLDLLMPESLETLKNIRNPEYSLLEVVSKIAEQKSEPLVMIFDIMSEEEKGNVEALTDIAKHIQRENDNALEATQ